MSEPYEMPKSEMFYQGTGAVSRKTSKRVTNGLIQAQAAAEQYGLELFRVRPQLFEQELDMGMGHIDNKRSVTVSKADLLKKLKENMATHATIVEEARTGYAKAVKAALVTLSERAAAEADELLHLTWEITVDAHDLIEELADLSAPTSYVEAYEDAIEVFTWDLETTITLSWGEFRKFVLDKWDWQDRFLNETVGFSQAARRRRAKK